MRWPWKRHAGSLFVPPTALGRSLTADEDAALRWILWLEDFPGTEELRAQVPHVRVTHGRTTELTLEVAGAARAPVSDGVLPVEALVVGVDDEPEGVITVWAEDGYLAALEYSWFTERMPAEYPPPDRLRLSDT